jgi:hypothetical protein
MGSIPYTLTPSPQGEEGKEAHRGYGDLLAVEVLRV